jgi:hypothetical protein
MDSGISHATAVRAENGPVFGYSNIKGPSSYTVHHYKPLVPGLSDVGQMAAVWAKHGTRTPYRINFLPLHAIQYHGYLVPKRRHKCDAAAVRAK